MRFVARSVRRSHRWDQDAGVSNHGRAAIEQLCLLVPLERLRRRSKARRVEAEITRKLAILPLHSCYQRHNIAAPGGAHG